MSTEDPKPAPGIYPARIVHYGMKKTKSGAVEPVIKLAVKVGDATHHVFWRGSLNGGAREHTIKALYTCGMTDVDGFIRGNFAKGPESKLLDMNRDVQAVVTHEVSQADPTKKYAQVQWINADGAGKFKDAIEAGEAGMALAGMNLGADFMEIAQANGVKIGRGTRPTTPPPATPTLDEIPF